MPASASAAASPDSTPPATSRPGMSERPGGGEWCRSRCNTSGRLTPLARTRISNSAAPGCGTGRSARPSTSGPPKERISTACMGRFMRPMGVGEWRRSQAILATGAWFARRQSLQHRWQWGSADALPGAGIGGRRLLLLLLLLRWRMAMVAHLTPRLAFGQCRTVAARRRALAACAETVAARGRAFGPHLHRQLDATPFVGFHHLDPHDLAFAQVIGHPLDALVGDLADVQQPVLAGQHLNYPPVNQQIF